MAYVMTAKQFVDKLVDIEKNYKTVYGMGLFGQVIAEGIIQQKVNQDKTKPISKRWWNLIRQAKIRSLIGKDYFGFDCICLAKAILWGWNGSRTASHGGAKYLSNGVPDVGADYTNNTLSIGRSTDFSKIKLGHYVWMTGHIGYYIGNGLVIECSPKWKNGVQITAVLNIGKKSGYNGRKWTTHGKLPWLDYSATNTGNTGNTNTGNINESEGDEGKIMLSRTLRHGMEGEDVGLVQQFLKNLGYYTGVVDNKFGMGVGFLNAVIAFQKAENLEPDGVIGAKTRARLIEMMLQPSNATADNKLKQENADIKAQIKRYKDFIAQLSSQLKNLT